jgi:hypothetical protein
MIWQLRDKRRNFVYENTNYLLLPQLPKRKCKKNRQEIVKKAKLFYRDCRRQPKNSTHACSWYWALAFRDTGKTLCLAEATDRRSE